MESQNTNNYRVSQICLGSFSCLLDILIIIFFFRAKLKRKATTGFEFIFYLSLCNFIRQTAYIINWEENPNFKLITNYDSLNHTVSWVSNTYKNNNYKYLNLFIKFKLFFNN